MNTHNTGRVDASLRSAGARVDMRDAERLLAHVLDKPRSWLFAHGDDILSPHAAERFDALISRCAAGEPVAYLIGRRGFWKFDLAVDAATLIPRPETELVAEVEFGEWTSEGILRHPAYLGLRDDKSPSQVVREG